MDLTKSEESFCLFAMRFHRTLRKIPSSSECELVLTQPVDSPTAPGAIQLLLPTKITACESFHADELCLERIFNN
ncbi:hypothetical protein GOP47_0020572 [Adiantum capillus-veneris]|uniref:Uncharacterized protein n=1 Tax=Adiantum capillus-veneris TaxID=13818 RepID=A0A9D4U9S1_ADICA|nr:hypothetical protein GOP47_0020572 [Adiantum capillus-veneris]